jgi:hypothetical protein
MAKRIRPAKNYQRKDAPIRMIVLGAKPKVAKALRASLGHLSTMVPTARAIALFKAGRWREIKGEIAWGHFREILKAPFNRIAFVHEAGAALGVQKINGAFNAKQRQVRFRKGLGSVEVVFGKDIGTQFNFDRFSQATQDALRQAQDDLIAQLEQSARDTIDQIVMSGALTGLGAEEIVSDIRDLIGLTDTQAQAVLNYRNMLENLDSGALQRQLRNDAMDQMVQDAIASGDQIAADQIDQMVQDYTDNYLDYRAATIAQTESARAANEGLHDAYSQAIDRGALPDDAVKREWELGDMPCPVCESIPDSNPDGVGVDEPFDSSDGPQDDPPVHPNACFAGTPFRSYGSLQQIARAKYRGPAIELKAVLFEDCAEASSRNTRLAESLNSAGSVTSERDSGGDLLLRNRGWSASTIAAREINITIGPNHPMLTRRGFVAAREIQEGDELLYDLRSQLAGGPGEIDLKQMPMFENAFAALMNAFEVISPTGPRTYFHGDEVFTYGEVDVVFPKRDLLPIWDAGLLQHLCECPLVGAYADAAHVAGCSACQQRFDFVFRAASGLMSRRDCGRALGFAEPLPPCFHSVRVVSSHWTTFVGDAFDASTDNAIYNAGGLVVKNCMCSVNYVTDLSKVPDDQAAFG